MVHLSASPPTSPDATLLTSIRCIECGYDLIGLPESGVCPECGAPIVNTTRGTLLQYASPEYLAKLHKGLLIILASILVSTALGIANMVFTVLPQFSMLSTGGQASPPVFMQAVNIAISITIAFAILVG